MLVGEHAGELKQFFDVTELRTNVAQRSSMAVALHVRLSLFAGPHGRPGLPHM